MAGERSPARSIVDLQRSRLLSAAVGLLAEGGYAGFSASAVCERAGVSRRTFYEIFENREACLAEILAGAEARFEQAISGLGLGGLEWASKIRMGLWAILCLADEDPALAKVCLLDSQHATGEAGQARERILARLLELVDEGRLQSTRTSIAGTFTAEALIGAASSVIAARLAQQSTPRAHANSVTGAQHATGARYAAGTNPARQAGGRQADGSPCAGVRGLLGELVGMIVLPYLGPAAARREIKRALPARPVVEIPQVEADAGGPSPLVEVPIRLTYRTARVLQAVATLTAEGMGVSNRLVADHAGISDAGQISKLLGRLQQHGLLENTAAPTHARGEANRWQLSTTGRRLVRTITTQASRSPQRSAA